MAQTCLGARLVNAELADALRKGGVSGLELRQVRFYRNDEPLPWYQMIATHTMPRMSKGTKGLLREAAPRWACPVCERDGYCGSPEQPLEIMYERREVDLDSTPDVVETWECFGRSLRPESARGHERWGLGSALILVKPKVLEIFRRLKVRKVCFQPVRIADAGEAHD